MKSYGLLIFIPVAIAANSAGVEPLIVFAAAALALAPLAKLTQKATDALSASLGPNWGGLLSASLGNAPEIIIGVSALRKGLAEVVKSSLVGSIVGNLLFALGLSMLAGGIRNGAQNFDRRIAGMNAALLTLAVAGLIIPAVFHHTSEAVTREISTEIAGILFLVYLGSLVYSLTTSRSAADQRTVEPKAEPEIEPTHEPAAAKGGWGPSLGILAAATIGLAVMSEVLTDALEPASRTLGLTPIFSGIFLLALAGNFAETYNAIGFARDGKLDLSLGVTVGSSIQVALVVAPVLIFCGSLLGSPMDLVFSRFELVAIVLSVLVTRQLTDDGRSTWLDGLMLVAVYVMLGVGFFYLPAGAAVGW